MPRGALQRGAAERHLSVSALFVAFFAIVGSFFAAAFVVQRSSRSIAELADGIIENSGPSIERMAQLRRAVLETELALSHYVEQPTQRDRHGATLDGALASARSSMTKYFDLPAYPEEQRLRIDLQAAWLRLEYAIGQTRKLADAGTQEAALRSFTDSVEPMRATMLEQATRIIETNAVHGRESARAIRSTRERTVWLARALNVLCALLAALVAWLLHRQVLARRALAEAHLATLETRASELEQFAGRVAHDIRNPLSAARVAAQLAGRARSPEVAQDLHHRIMRSLSRADAITTALLEFARSGAKPDPGARTSPGAAVADVMTELSHDAEAAGIELRAEATPSVGVACGRGVYLSLLGNLVKNAIKYMRDAPQRRITIRVLDEGASVRTEVIDTGPGIPADALATLFQPYFRGPTGGAEGLGLGLATVKRLAEGHGGQVGVTSAQGRGSTFWFTLPRVALDDDQELDADRAEEQPTRWH